MAKASDLSVNLERGVPTDKVLAARKGSAVLTVDFMGRAAHSGLEAEKGRNAVLEAARVALAIAKLGDQQKQTTVEVDILAGGDKTKVIPDYAVIKADVRAFTAAQAAAQIAASPEIIGVTSEVRCKETFLPGRTTHAPMG